MKTYFTLLAAAVFAAALSTSPAQTLNWGSAAFSDMVDSTGQALPDNAFVFELGAFADGFTPEESNVNSWLANWRVFDQGEYNQGNGVFIGVVNILGNVGGNDGVYSNDPGASTMSFAGLGAYIWVRNHDVADVGTEWFLARAGTWTFPTTGGDCCDTNVIEWSVTDLTNSDSPLYGKQGTTSGLGGFTDTGSHALQTYSFVPEPSAFLLTALTGVGAMLRRRRSEI